MPRVGDLAQKVALCGAVAVVTATGVATPEALRALRSSYRGELKAPPGAFVFDYRGLVWGLTLDKALALVRECPRTAATPAAFVVNPSAVDAWMEFALSVALEGVMRPVFVDLHRAKLWAQRAAGGSL